MVVKQERKSMENENLQQKYLHRKYNLRLCELSMSFRGIVINVNDGINVLLCQENYVHGSVSPLPVQYDYHYAF